MLDVNKRVFLQHVTQLFDSSLLSQLRARFDEVENLNQNEHLDPREVNALKRGESSDRTRMQTHWYDIWAKSHDTKKILNTVSPYTYVTFPPQVRNVRAHSHKVPWHQDIGYMRLLGNRGHTQVITCFVPLEEDPSQHTTIQFALDNLSTEETVFTHMPMDDFGAGIADANFKEKIHHCLALGDALVFGDFTLHRTFTPEGCKVERRSLEFRLIQPQHAIAGKDYFDLETRQFIKG